MQLLPPALGRRPNRSRRERRQLPSPLHALGSTSRRKPSAAEVPRRPRSSIGCNSPCSRKVHVEAGPHPPPVSEYHHSRTGHRGQCRDLHRVHPRHHNHGRHRSLHQQRRGLPYLRSMLPWLGLGRSAAADLLMRAMAVRRQSSRVGRAPESPASPAPRGERSTVCERLALQSTLGTLRLLSCQRGPHNEA